VIILSIHQNCDINALPHPKRGSEVGYWNEMQDYDHLSKFTT